MAHLCVLLTAISDADVHYVKFVRICIWEKSLLEFITDYIYNTECHVRVREIGRDIDLMYSKSKHAK